MIKNSLSKIKIVLLFLILFFSVLSTPLLSFSAASPGVTYTEDGGIVSNPSPTTQPNNSQGGFTYKTLVNIPGLGENGVVTISPNSLGLYLQVIFNYIIGAAIALAVVMIMWGGLTYATTDAIGKKEEGKKIIKDALYGLALALGSFLILNTINPDLLKFDLALPQLTATKTQDGTLADVTKGRLEGLQNGSSSPSSLSTGRSSGPAIACASGLVSNSEFGKTVTICSNLLQKLKALKSATPNTKWIITSTVTGNHLSACHKPGNEKSGSCADVAITSGTWDDLCKGIRNTSGLSALNEAAGTPGCVAALGPFTKTPKWTGPHLHINLVGN